MLHSASLQPDMPYRVILPASVPPNFRLPVVYLLHGGGGGYKDWSNYSDVAQFAEHGLILVMPEGNSSYYVNAAERPRDRYEDYITKDLIADVESRFPVASGRTNRAIVGISMGGFGAVTLALKHPDLYAFVGGISPALDVPSRPFSFKRIGQYREHARIFGPWGSETRRANNPYVLAETADPSKVPYLYLTCGEQEGLLPGNKRFAAILQQRGFQYEFSPWARRARLEPVERTLARFIHEFARSFPAPSLKAVPAQIRTTHQTMVVDHGLIDPMKDIAISEFKAKCLAFSKRSARPANRSG